MTYASNKAFFDSMIQGGFDITKKEIIVSNQKYYLCYINSLIDNNQILEVVKGLYQGKTLMDLFALYAGASTVCIKRQNAITSILSGQCLLLENDNMYLIEVRNYPNQSSNEAKNEQSIRGSHDSFVENIILNVGLLRRRIRDTNLRICLHQEGSLCKTDIAYLYIENLVDKTILNNFKKRLLKLESVEVIYERTLCDALYGKTWNPYPSVRYCERPDICAIHLLQGYIVILVDNSFTAIILPTSFFELTKQIEEYTQTSLVAVFIRVVRLLAVFLSIYMLPIWLLIQTINNSTIFNIPILEMGNKSYILFQVIFIEFLIEWIRLSFIHTPQTISGVMGFLFVFILGESAIELQFYTEMILVLVVLSNICNFVTPNYELSLANKLSRIFLSILTITCGLNGFSIGLLIHFIILIYTRNEANGYLYPIIPFDLREIKRLILGTPIHFHSNLKRQTRKK